ncbi:BglG family transcription antiterminator [Streptococcus sp. CSL10205-OR2]|uniref:BglG family transcription antiterminator n=1 Tax=Streptococcus sp. CSL10205-OR2 TaxID=2980558 RepID=UPI0021D934DE|nr:transcription antiterminator [Streptococcus sp. CSL10205-OR2]MCU9533062.1 transcription antiterminator [Streptococcus sp. CSL10205-OR2]
MMLLDKKSYDLLSYLINLDEAETVMTISHTLGQSRRKIYYHLEKINDALPQHIDQIESYPRIGILLTTEQKEACQKLLDEVSDYHYVMKSDERIKLSAVYIAISPERVIIDKLMQINDVSRNTVLNDLNELREKLAQKEYSIKLHASKSRGYYFECHPLSLIQFLYKVLDGIYHGENTSFIDYFDHRLEETLGLTTYFSKEVHDYIEQFLISSQTSLGKTINRQDSQFMVKILPFILLSYRNMQFSNHIKSGLDQDFDLIWKRKEYVIAKEFAQQLRQKFDIHLDNIETGLVAMLMLSFRKDKDSHVESRDYEEMRHTLQTFIEEIENCCHIEFLHKDDLLKQLMIHCKALIYRKTYGIFAANSLTAHIKEKYHDLFTITKAHIHILEEKWDLAFDDDEIAYITIHLGGAFKNSKQEIPKTEVILVSDDGIGLQKLLLNQFQHYLPNCNVQAIFTTEQFQSVSDLISEDTLVVSTSSCLEIVLPFLVVHPILSDEDIIRLIHFIKHGSLSDNFYLSEELYKSISQFVSEDIDRKALKHQIEKLIRRELMNDIFPRT